MTDEQRASWQAYVDDLKPTLRLCDWRITIDPEPADEGNDATIWTSNDYQTAKLYLGNEWTDHDAAKQREIMAHEMVHIHLSRVGMIAEKVANQLGGQAKGMADEMIEHFLETATEELARVIAPFLPLPPKVKREKKAA